MKVGAKVKAIRPLTSTEMSKVGWDSRRPVIAIEFDDKTVLYASRDEEGNGPGVLFYDDLKTGLSYVLGVE
jgi:hypothetical protein